MNPEPTTWHRLTLTLAVTLLVVSAGAACGPVYVDDGYGYRQPQAPGYVPPSAAPRPPAAAPATRADAEAQFPDLAAHGRWMYVEPWGKVWVPAANGTTWWRPYYLGQWTWTEHGWTWASEEPWGWGPYHYGRWAWHANWRWVWVPGYTWGPAWVSWRSGGGCVGWAPMGPGGHAWGHHAYWTFVPHHHMTSAKVYHVVVPPQRVTVVYNQSKPVGSDVTVRNPSGKTVIYNSGPARADVKRWVGHDVPPRPANSVPGAVPRRPGGDPGAPRAGARSSEPPRVPNADWPRQDPRQVPLPQDGRRPATARPDGPVPPTVHPNAGSPARATPPKPYYGAHSPAPANSARPDRDSARPAPPPPARKKRKPADPPKSVPRQRETPKWVRQPSRDPGARGR